MTISRVSLDTNVVLRFIVGDDPQQRRRAHALLATSDVVFLVSDMTWAEVEYALRVHYGKARKQVAALIGAFATFPSLLPDSGAVVAACEHYVGHPKLSFVDCLSACRAASDGAIPLYTFDAKLARQHPAAALVP